MINKDGGKFLDFMEGHSCYKGDIELMGIPPLGKPCTNWYRYLLLCWHIKQYQQQKSILIIGTTLENESLIQKSNDSSFR